MADQTTQPEDWVECLLGGGRPALSQALRPAGRGILGQPCCLGTARGSPIIKALQGVDGNERDASIGGGGADFCRQHAID